MTSSANHNSDAPKMLQMLQYLPLFQNSFQIIFNFFPETFEIWAIFGAFGAFLEHHFYLLFYYYFNTTSLIILLL
jgi:hypothetical protein